MRIRFTETISTPNIAYRRGREYDVPTAEAESYISHRVAMPINATTAEAPQTAPPTTAELALSTANAAPAAMRASSKARGKKKGATPVAETPEAAAATEQIDAATPRA